MSNEVFGEFEWDSTKAEINLSVHGVSFAEATTVFGDHHAYYFDNGSPEGRLCVVGHSIQGRVLLVVHAEVEGDRIRIISARRPSPAERKAYEGC